MEKVQAIIPAAWQNLGLRKLYNEKSAIVHWQDIVGISIAKNAWPVKVERGSLLVQVSNSVWHHHLSMIKEDIIAKINHYLAETLIHELRFQTGSIKIAETDENEEQKECLFFHSSGIILDRQEDSAIEDIAAATGDRELRSKIVRVLKKDFKLKKFKYAHRWHPCKNCSVLCPPDEELCAACTLKQRNSLLEEIRKLLLEAPWLKYYEINEYLPCRPFEYDLAKEGLITRLIRGLPVQEEHIDRLELITLSMLITCIKPEAITDEFLRQILQKIRRKANVHSSRG